MESVSVNQFRAKLREHIERVVNDHEPIKVTRRNGEDFVVLSLDDWNREQETVHVLNNVSLLEQIQLSMKTHESKTGYQPKAVELDEIIGV